MEQVEQPEVQEVETIEDGGSQVSDILTKGLKDKADSPEDVSQAGEEVTGNQPKAEEVEELFGELLLEDEKKMPFKTQEELDAFIERNLDLFGKHKGFMLQSDYTRKTQELSKEREEIAKIKNDIDSGWGTTKPNEGSMKAFYDLWSVFQHGGESLQQKINSFLGDVSLLAGGQQPRGPLSEGSQGTNNAESVALRRELSEIKAQMERSQTKIQEDKSLQVQQEAERDWNGWVKAQSDKGVKITPEIEKEMYPFLIGMSQASMSNQEKLDTAYDLVAKKMGLDKSEPVKKVFEQATKQAKKSPKSPSFKASPSTQKQASTVSEILNQAKEDLAG